MRERVESVETREGGEVWGPLGVGNVLLVLRDVPVSWMEGRAVVEADVVYKG